MDAWTRNQFKPKLPAEDQALCYELLKEGLSLVEVAEKFDLSPATLQRCMHRYAERNFLPTIGELRTQPKSAYTPKYSMREDLLEFESTSLTQLRHEVDDTTNEPIVVTYRKRPAFVMIPVEQLPEDWQERLA